MAASNDSGALPPGAGAAREPAASAPSVRRLVLTNFRSYESLRLELDHRPVVLTGANGQGKTNLLEALSMFGPGRGLRRARLDELTRHGARAPWTIAARLQRGEATVDIGTGLSRAEGEGTDRRLVRIDGAPTRSVAALAELASVIWLTPQMDQLFTESSSARRRFLDRTVFAFEPAHAERLATYEKAMRERNRVLKSGAWDSAWLGALERTMAEAGVAIAAARRTWSMRLDQALAAEAGVFPRPAISVAGALEATLAEAPAVDVEDRFRRDLADNRRGDQEAGGARIGPHRADLEVRDAARDMPAADCSTGEQKALLIALILGTVRLQAIERGTMPIVLLDEVAAHLDAGRRAALYDRLTTMGAQAWLTGTDRALFEPLAARGQFFTVRAGRVEAD